MVNFTDEPYTPNHFVPFKHTENILITISEEEEILTSPIPFNDQSLELIVNIDPEYQDNLFQKKIIRPIYQILLIFC